jgi:hypothetical protein
MLIATGRSFLRGDKFFAIPAAFFKILRAFVSGECRSPLDFLLTTP